MRVKSIQTSNASGAGSCLLVLTLDLLQSPVSKSQSRQARAKLAWIGRSREKSQKRLKAVTRAPITSHSREP